MGDGSCRGGERGRGGSKDSSERRGGNGRDKSGGGSVCGDSVGDGSIDKGISNKDGSGNGSWLGNSEVGSKDLRHANKGACFIAGTGGRHGDNSGGKGRTGFGKLQVSSGGTVARRS